MYNRFGQPNRELRIAEPLHRSSKLTMLVRDSMLHRDHYRGQQENHQGETSVKCGADEPAVTRDSYLAASQLDVRVHEQAG